MKKYKAVVNGLGNIGREAIAAIEVSGDFECVGVIRRKQSIGKNKNDLRGIDEYTDISDIINKHGKVDVCLQGTPSRNAKEDNIFYLEKGINTVDSFDVHGEIASMVESLDPIAKKNNVVAITSSGWDPGTDSILRTLFEAMIPMGTTFTNFGRGLSMGHSVVARSIEGVSDAFSITIPLGGGKHSRLVYVVLESNANFDDVCKRIKKDDYFAHDSLDVREVKNSTELSRLVDSSHGVLMERTGASGLTSNQILKFDMRINNPALTSQVMLSSARAALRMQAGCYTLIDIPPVYFLEGERLDNIARLV